MNDYNDRDATHLDLFTGMLAENPLPDGLLGPTASCIIADQFVRAKRGDRFWYETADPLLRFTPGKNSIVIKSNRSEKKL